MREDSVREQLKRLPTGPGVYLFRDERGEIKETKDAAAIEPISCAVHGVDLLKLRPYQKALVIGDGFMGQLFAQIVQAYGVHQVDLAGIFDEKLKRNQCVTNSVQSAHGRAAE